MSGLKPPTYSSASCRSVASAPTRLCKSFPYFKNSFEAHRTSVQTIERKHAYFEDAPPELRSLHHVAGRHFYAIGEPVKALPVANA